MASRRHRQRHWVLSLLWRLALAGTLVLALLQYFAALPRLLDTGGNAPGRPLWRVGDGDGAAEGAGQDGGADAATAGRRPAAPAAAAPAGAAAAWAPHGRLSRRPATAWRPVELQLRLPREVLEQPALRSEAAMFRQYGFDLNFSNHLPLRRHLADHRSAACRARPWPPLDEMPKASVIIIFYNEPLSTLLRNVLGVLNRSPPDLLGEVLLVDDHSVLGELAALPEHLERLQRGLPSGKVRLVRREVHDGIVGARNRGAREARYPVIVILDSHVEVTEGWLEPLVGRIYGDRRRVVVPNIMPINLHTLDPEGGNTWPPLRGSFNWRLSFTIALADAQRDLVEADVVDSQCSAIRTPVMPGGLFAMDRAYFFELGAYDPEIQYYGAEHVEMSFRVWMCGGSMEIMPCSQIGHIYREFDRFGVDEQLRGVNIGAVLDRNDARVAEVWMDDYKTIFYKYRPMPLQRFKLGDLTLRKGVREKLHCKSFKWFLDEVCRDHYVPDPGLTQVRQLRAAGSPNLCVSNKGSVDGPVALEGCSRSSWQLIEHTSKGYLQFAAHFDHKLVCIRIQIMSQVACAEAPRWEFADAGEIRSLDRPGMCLDRGRAGEGAETLDLQSCSGALSQRWLRKPSGTLSGPAWDVCLDNMQRTSGAPGLYPCHGGSTQQWVHEADRRIRNGYAHDGAGVCLGFAVEASINTCQLDDPGFAWLLGGAEGRCTLRPAAAPALCLEHRPGGGAGAEAGAGRREVVVGTCREEASSQRWELDDARQTRLS